jgi:hypothetical protein
LGVMKLLGGDRLQLLQSWSGRRRPSRRSSCLATPGWIMSLVLPSLRSAVVQLFRSLGRPARCFSAGGFNPKGIRTEPFPVFSGFPGNN